MDAGGSFLLEVRRPPSLVSYTTETPGHCDAEQTDPGPLTTPNSGAAGAMLPKEGWRVILYLDETLNLQSTTGEHAQRERRSGSQAPTCSQMLLSEVFTACSVNLLQTRVNRIEPQLPSNGAAR